MTMLARSLATSLRASIARPATSVSLRSCALARSYADDAGHRSASDFDDNKSDTNGNGSGTGDTSAAADEAAKKIADLEAKIKDITVRLTLRTKLTVQKEMTYLRADYQTLSRRAAEDKHKASAFAIASFARSLLDTTDVLSKALASVPQPVEPGTPLGELFDGVKLTQKALTKTLEHHDIKPMEDPKGAKFDPKFHEATFQVPPAAAPKRADGGAPEAGEVIEVQEPGWMIKDRVLRPAQVGIVQME